MKKVNILDAHIKFGPDLFHLTWEKRGDFKKGHRLYEKKDELGGPKNESLCFKWDTPTIFRPKIKIQHDQHQNAMTKCNDLFLLCRMFPQPPSPNALFFVVFTKVQMLNKNTQSPFILPLDSSFFPPSFLFASPSSMHVSIVLSSCHYLASFCSLTTTEHDLKLN